MRVPIYFSSILSARKYDFLDIVAKLLSILANFTEKNGIFKKLKFGI